MDSKISFKAYSRQYDRLLDYSTPYIKLLEVLRSKLQLHCSAGNVSSVLDIGAGTGNISKVVLDTIDCNSIDLVEPSKEMLAIARSKLVATDLAEHNTSFEDFRTKKTYDLVVCVHAMYLMKDPLKAVEQFKQYMHDESILIVCDIGQEINVLKWTLHLLWTNIPKHGLWSTLKVLSSSKDVRRANMEIQRQQRLGAIWNHTLADFENYFNEDYHVFDRATAFLGCSNLLVCKRKKCRQTAKY
jgi:SAM-dependent methyltransferase